MYVKFMLSMSESESRVGVYPVPNDLMVFILVQHVHWLRAWAQKNRWDEELTLLRYEMEWTTRYFLYRAKEWEKRFDLPDMELGPKAYAARQAAQWLHMASDAERMFRTVNREYHTVIM
jgi:hypothetical protein